jgi:hypothetical protein
MVDFLLRGTSGTPPPRAAKSYAATFTIQTRRAIRNMTAAEVMRFKNRCLIAAVDDNDVNLVSIVVTSGRHYYGRDGGRLPHLASRMFTRRELNYYRRLGERRAAYEGHNGGTRVPQSRSVALRGLQRFRTSITSWLHAVAREFRDEFDGPLVVVVGNGRGGSSRASASAAAVDELRRTFANVYSTEYGSSKCCIACGSVMTEKDPKGCRRGRGVGGRRQFFFSFFFLPISLFEQIIPPPLPPPTHTHHFFL